MPSGVFTLKQVEQAIGQGAWTNQPPISVNYLVVAGGGAGAYQGAGGAGGLLQGTFGITAGTSYTVTVGSGGAGAAGGAKGSDGSNSVFGPISAFGGGAGGGTPAGTTSNGNSGGSGGGSADSGTPIGIGGQGTAGQGNRGGNAATTGASGGGGGAGTPGLNGVSSSICGNGGAGVASDISGVRTVYAGGGGGGPYSTNTAGKGGAGGGGDGGTSGTNSAGQSGSANTGGGAGGSAYNNAHVTAASGGSGIVIVSYPGTTQWFTGGTLSYGNGNIVHSFYSSGTLAPTTPSTYVDTGYQISRSLRFNSADSAYLNRTPASAGNRQIFTWSAWIKIGKFKNDSAFISSGSAVAAWAYINFQSDSLSIYETNSGASYNLQTTQVFRDPSAWYHLVVAFDTTQATASNRIKVYVNGVQVTSFSIATYPTQNFNTWYNSTTQHGIGRLFDGSSGYYFDGYQTEVNFIDGQALTPQSFGYYNPDTGVWSPLKFVGTYGTNGFYLNFSDNSNTTAATLGKDYSGNGNNWTPNNFSVAAGAGNDSLVDSPTAYGTDTGAGGTVRGNYATLNPVDKGSSISASNGNLDVTAAGAWQGIRATLGMSSGKWYCEYTPTSGIYHIVSISQPQAVMDSYIVNNATAWGYQWDGTKITNNTASSYGAGFGSGDVIGLAFDADAGTLVFYKNGVSQGTAFSGLTSGPYLVGIGTYPSATGTFNFGQRPFAYTAPSGFKALCTQNLSTPTIGATTATQAGKFFNPVLYTGNRPSTQSISGVGFQPDFVWIKGRQNTWFHRLYDAVRGATKVLESNTTSAEATASGLTSFNSDGFSVGAEPSENQPSEGFVAWNWKANGAGSSNTAGSITSTVSANTTSGFSIVTFTTGVISSVQTWGHGLGVAPAMVITRWRDSADDWYVYHKSLGATQYIRLNMTGAAATLSSIWNNTEPTSSVFTFGSAFQSVHTMIAYCFAPIAGYSAFGSYTGNSSSDGPFIYCGFRPRYVLIKLSSGGLGDWVIYDAVRNTSNVMSSVLYADLANAEGTVTGIDFTSNGFKLRGTSSDFNGGYTYIYAAFAESPFKYSLAR